MLTNASFLNNAHNTLCQMLTMQINAHTANKCCCHCLSLLSCRAAKESILEAVLEQKNSGTKLTNYNFFMELYKCQIKQWGLHVAVQHPDVFSPVPYYERLACLLSLTELS